MDTPAAHDLSGFYQFVGEIIRRGEDTLSPEQALDEWRMLQPTLQLSQEDLSDIDQAVQALNAGDKGTPLAAFDREFRERHSSSFNL